MRPIDAPIEGWRFDVAETSHGLETSFPATIKLQVANPVATEKFQDTALSDQSSAISETDVRLCKTVLSIESSNEVETTEQFVEGPWPNQGRIKTVRQKEHESRIRQVALVRHFRNARSNVEQGATNFKRKVAGSLLGFMALAGGLQEIPPALGQPTIETTIAKQLESYVVNKIGGWAIYQQAAVLAEVAHETPVEFEIQNSKMLQNTGFGDTFDPARCMPTTPKGENPITFVESQAGQIGQQDCVNALRFEIEDEAVRNIRFPISWQDSVDANGNFSMAYVAPYLSELENDINPVTHRPVQVTLSDGPLKSPGWPETHLSTLTTDSVDANTTLVPSGTLPPVDYEFTPASNKLYPNLLIPASNWLNDVMQYISKNDPKIQTIQLDNEPLNRFGDLQWTMSPEFEKQYVQIARKYIPHAVFLVNFAGIANLANGLDDKNAPDLEKELQNGFELLQLQQMFSKESIINEIINYRKVLLSAMNGEGDVVIGIDYYDETSNSPTIKVNINGKSYEVLVDTNALIDITEKLAGDTNPIAKLHRLHIPVVITESEAEPWTPYSDPGKSVHNFEYTVVRDNQFLSTNGPTSLGLYELWPIIMELQNHPQNFTTNQVTKVLTDPTGKFVSDQESILQMIAFADGVSKLSYVNGKPVINNNQIDSDINQYLSSDSGHTMIHP
jgi:hypothetical protein